jgi:RNA polymerase sigma-70 factor (ECF subfamily)
MALSFRTSQLLTLLERLRAGDRAAADELFQHAGDRLERLARKMLRGFPAVRRWEETGDILQDASVRLLRALEEVRPDNTRQFFALASLQIRRVLLDLKRQLRARNLLHHTDGAAADAGTPAHEPADPAPGMDELEAWCEVHQQIDELPEDEREVMDLCFYQGLAKEDAAAVLGVSVRTVQRHWNAVLIHLNELLQARHPVRGA